MWEFLSQMGNFEYKKSVFVLISNCNLTFVKKCIYKRKSVPEFLVMLDFSKMRSQISGLLKIIGLAISGLAYFET
jgi:hypothetical protein